MIIGIFIIGLKEIVVNIAYREFCLNTSNVHGLKFEVCECSRGILGEGLIDADTDLSTHLPFT